MERKIDDERIPYGLAVHDEEEERAVSEVIRNHQTIMGDNVKQFEREIADKFGKEIGVMVNSGSSANLLTFEVLDLPKEFSFQWARHTYSTNVLKAGVNPKAISESLGHTSFKTTENYFNSLLKDSQDEIDNVL